MLGNRRMFARRSERGNPLSVFLPVPLNKTSLVLQLRSDLGITTSSGSVTNWNDQSGNGNNFVGGTTKPTYNTSDSDYAGLPSLSSVTATLMTNTTINVSQPNTTYIVCKKTSNASTDNLIDAATTRQIIQYDSGGHDWDFFAGTTINGTNGTTGAVVALCAVFNGGSSALYQGNSGGKIAGGNAGANGWTNPYLFSSNGSFGFNGTLAEVLLYSVAHTPAQVHAVFRYFAGRYQKAFQ